MRNRIAREQATCLLNEFSVDVVDRRLPGQNVISKGSFEVRNVALGKRGKREDLREVSAKFSNVAIDDGKFCERRKI